MVAFQLVLQSLDVNKATGTCHGLHGILNSKVSPCCSTCNCWMLKLQYLFNLSLVARWCVPPRIGRLRVTAREERAWDRGYTAPTFKYTLPTTGKIGDWMVVTQI